MFPCDVFPLEFSENSFLEKNTTDLADFKKHLVNLLFAGNSEKNAKALSAFAV